LVPLVLAALLGIAMQGCGGGGSQSGSSKELKQIDIATTTIGSAFKAMLNEERMFSQGTWEPKQANLETYWMAFTSTTLDMKRLERVLEANPDLRPQTREMWVGRIQDNLDQMRADGMFTEMKGGITSKLGEAFGKDRVVNEGAKMLKAVDSIESMLGVSGNPGQ